MRLSIECNGCKATLTSGSSLAPVAATETEKAKIKKERRVAERRPGVPYGTVARDSPSKHFSEKSGKPKKKKKSLSDFFELSSPSSTNECSNQEEEKISSTRFSSRCFSSDSSEYYGRIKNKNKNKQKENASESAAAAMAAAKVSRGVAVVEQSSDPYGDFRRSMVEMIMAGQKLGAGDLNRLLRSYLTLNPPQHHPVILKAFSDLFIGGSV